MLMIGVDEAGRGPVLGPLVVGGVLLKSNYGFRKAGVRDSKCVSLKNRKRLYTYITDHAVAVSYRIIPAGTIDTLRSMRSLNVIEAEYFARVIADLMIAAEEYISSQVSFGPEKIDHFVESLDIDMDMIDPDISIQRESIRIRLDAADVKPRSFKQQVMKYLGKIYHDDIYGPRIIIESMHKADERYVEVGAASIIAKYMRDQWMADACTYMGLNIGSGYSHDPITRRFMEEYVVANGKLPPDTRHSWSTAKKLMSKYSVSKVTLDTY